MELHEQALGTPLGAAEAVDAHLRGRRARLLRHVARDQTVVAPVPRPSAVPGVPYAGGGDGDRQALRLAGPRHDRVQAETATARLPVLLDAVTPERLVELPSLAPIAAREERTGVGARVQHPVLYAE